MVAGLAPERPRAEAARGGRADERHRLCAAHQAQQVVVGVVVQACMCLPASICLVSTF